MYKRILLKLSGEALKGNASTIIDPETVKAIARQKVLIIYVCT